MEVKVIESRRLEVFETKSIRLFKREAGPYGDSTEISTDYKIHQIVIDNETQNWVITDPDLERMVLKQRSTELELNLTQNTLLTEQRKLLNAVLDLARFMSMTFWERMVFLIKGEKLWF